MYIYEYILILCYKNILLLDHLSLFCIFGEKFHDPQEILYDKSVEKHWFRDRYLDS